MVQKKSLKKGGRKVAAAPLAVKKVGLIDIIGNRLAVIYLYILIS